MGNNTKHKKVKEKQSDEMSLRESRDNLIKKYIKIFGVVALYW